MPNSSSYSQTFQQLAYAYGCPQAEAVLKSSPEDFQVEEQIAYPLSGEGEHLWLWVEKQSQNTDWVAKQLANYIGVPARQIGVAGKKDRHALTWQWMSVQLPGKADPDFSDLAIPGVRILKRVRHSRKLQTGGLSGNRFTLHLRDFVGDVDETEKRLQQIKAKGVPNYFGAQRFGNDFQNLPRASKYFAGEIRPKRHQKTMYLSAARSWLFNQVVSQRLQMGQFASLLAGDVLQLNGSSKWFLEDGSTDLAQRVSEGDLHPTAPLTGRGELPSRGEVRRMEEAVFAQHPIWQSGMEKAGLKQDRRAVRVLVPDLAWQWQDDCQTLALTFTLPAGSFATMVVREVCQLANVDSESGC